MASSTFGFNKYSVQAVWVSCPKCVMPPAQLWVQYPFPLARASRDDKGPVYGLIHAMLKALIVAKGVNL
jgi:hypothetical protein